MRQLVRQLAYQVWYTRYQVSFYLWWIWSVLKYCRVPKYYDQDLYHEDNLEVTKLLKKLNQTGKRFFWKLQVIGFKWFSEIHVLYRRVDNVLDSNLLTSRLSSWNRKSTSRKLFVKFSYSTSDNLPGKKWLNTL